MEHKIEGLILSKTHLARRNIIARLLLRSGKKVSVSFSSGKRNNIGLVEAAHMLKVELSPTRSTNQLYRAKEWNILWASGKIRNDYSTFSVVCLILEILQYVSVAPDLHDPSYYSDNEYSGVFSVASNALYRLDGAKESPHAHLLPFLGKLLIALGVFPRIDICIKCNRPLSEGTRLALDAGQGGFFCESCLLLNKSEHRASLCINNLHSILAKIARNKYRDIPLCSDTALFDSLLNYFCHQFQFSQRQFKSLSAVRQTFPPSF